MQYIKFAVKYEIYPELAVPGQELSSIEQFLNLVLVDGKVVSYKMIKAYFKLGKAQDVLNGRLGAINLEQLDVLLLSLKSSWDCSKQRSFLDDIKALPTKPREAEKVLAYEL